MSSDRSQGRRGDTIFDIHNASLTDDEDDVNQNEEGAVGGDQVQNAQINDEELDIDQMREQMRRLRIDLRDERERSRIINVV